MIAAFSFDAQQSMVRSLLLVAFSLYCFLLVCLQSFPSQQSNYYYCKKRSAQYLSLSLSPLDSFAFRFSREWLFVCFVVNHITLSVRYRPLQAVLGPFRRPAEFEGVLHPAFEEDEIQLILLGGVLGAAVGVIQIFTVF